MADRGPESSGPVRTGQKSNSKDRGQTVESETFAYHTFLHPLYLYNYLTNCSARSYFHNSYVTKSAFFTFELKETVSSLL